MNWYNYFACFFAGAFLSNFAPHFIKGITGEQFPTPFAKPRARGMSSPPVNVMWGLFNLTIGLILLWAGNASACQVSSLAVVFSGFAVTSVLISRSATKINNARHHSEHNK